VATTRLILVEILESSCRNSRVGVASVTLFASKPRNIAELGLQKHVKKHTYGHDRRLTLFFTRLFTWPTIRH
jgi:hypothetical protein